MENLNRIINLIQKTGDRLVVTDTVGNPAYVVMTLADYEKLAVIISDTFANPNRKGTIGVAIGIAGIRHSEIREDKNKFVANIASVDALASAVYPIMGQSEGLPVVVARGARYSKDEKASIRNLLNRYEDYGWSESELMLLLMKLFWRIRSER